MACENCTSTAPLTTFDVQYFYSNQCFECGPSTACEGKINNSACIIYTGPALSCSGIATNDSVEVALQKIDEQVCAIIGDYANYQFNCLTAWYGTTITTEAQFVDAITAYACDLSTNFYTFVDSAFLDYQTQTANRLAALEVPGITCAFAGVTAGDTLEQVLARYCNAFGTINDSLLLTSVVWDACLTVITPPTTIQQGFQLLADQICQVYASTGGVLPTFDNTGSCLPTPTASDTLVDTVDKIKTVLCALPAFDPTTITWGCVGSQTDLQSTIQALVAQDITFALNYPTFSGDFLISATDPMDPCAGITVALATPLNQDRLVAVSALDATPGVLVDKVTSLGLSLDVTNNADSTLNIELANGDKGDITTTAGPTWTINPAAVTYAKIQDAGALTLIGNPNGASASVEEIGIGAGLSFSGTNLVVSGRTLVAVTKFTSNGTWTKNASTTAVLVITVGGGGGGAGTDSAANCSVASGGGGGATSWNYITSGLGATETVTVGGGGAGGIGNSNGASGGNTSFGAHVIVSGGVGGFTLVEGTTGDFALGGSAGALTGTGPATYIFGGAGTNGGTAIRLSGTMGIHGIGGSSMAGGGGNVLAPGSGGDGALAAIGADTNTGNPGEGGIVVVFEYS